MLRTLILSILMLTAAATTALSQETRNLPAKPVATKEAAKPAVTREQQEQFAQAVTAQERARTELAQSAVQARYEAATATVLGLLYKFMAVLGYNPETHEPQLNDKGELVGFKPKER